jgi:hypothetical protein
MITIIIAFLFCFFLWIKCIQFRDQLKNCKFLKNVHLFRSFYFVFTSYNKAFPPQKMYTKYFTEFTDSRRHIHNFPSGKPYITCLYIRKLIQHVTPKKLRCSVLTNSSTQTFLRPLYLHAHYQISEWQWYQMGNG